MRTQAKYHKEKNVLELNPHAPIIQELNKIIEVIFYLTFRSNPTPIALN